jgi:hypothetical protein
MHGSEEFLQYTPGGKAVAASLLGLGSCSGSLQRERDLALFASDPDTSVS